MKRLLLILLFFSIKINSQELTGNWKVISYEDDIVYYNKITDSISYKNSSRKEEADNFIKTSEFLIFPITYIFDNNANIVVNHETMGKITSGKFEVDKTNKKIIIIDEKGIKDEFPYIFSNEILFLEMKMRIGYIKMGLMKSSN
jgi:hypothetical protein